MEIKRIPYTSTWTIRHEVMWPDKPIDYVKLKEDEEGMHYGLFVNDKMVSVVSTYITGSEAQFRKFATLNEEQGKGYGTKLLLHLLVELENKKLQKVWCNSRIDKVSFYERFGMIETSQKFSKSGIAYVIMEKNYKNLEYIA